MDPKPKRFLKPSDIQEILGLSKSGTYNFLSSGALQTIRVGKSIRVPAEALDKWLSEQVTTK